MKPILQTIFVAVVALPGCSSGGSDDADAALDTLSFAQLAAGFDDLQAQAATEDPTLSGNLPDSGSVFYDGQIFLSPEADPSDGVMGTLEIEVDFPDDAFTGRAEGFFNLDAQSVDGSIDITNGDIIRVNAATEVLLTADVDGTVTFDAGEMTVDADMTGTFQGGTGALLTGAIVGVAEPSSGPDVAVTGIILSESR